MLRGDRGDRGDVSYTCVGEENIKDVCVNVFILRGEERGVDPLLAPYPLSAFKSTVNCGLNLRGDRSSAKIYPLSDRSIPSRREFRHSDVFPSVGFSAETGNRVDAVRTPRILPSVPISPHIQAKSTSAPAGQFSGVFSPWASVQPAGVGFGITANATVEDHTTSARFLRLGSLRGGPIVLAGLRDHRPRRRICFSDQEGSRAFRGQGPHRSPWTGGHEPRRQVHPFSIR